MIQSHRGAGLLAPENTLPTFELAWQIGTVPEADLRSTRDGVIVAFHDETFARLVKDAPPALRRKGVRDLSWSEVSQLDVGAWKDKEFEGQRIPMVVDVFGVMRGCPTRRLYLDVKDISLEALAKLVGEYAVERQVILASTDYDLVRRWKRLVPASQTLLWMKGTEAALAKRLDELRAAGFEGVTQLQIHVTVNATGAADPFAPSSSFLRSVGQVLRRHGILFQALPFGRSETDVYRRLMDLGVESFATDDPMTTLSAVRAYRERNGRRDPRPEVCDAE